MRIPEKRYDTKEFSMYLLAIDWEELHTIIRNLYTELIPLAAGLIGPARAIAGTGATLYIASRVWRHIAAAEPIDFYPLFRPLVIGMVLGGYMGFIAFINGCLQPTVAATESMVETQQSQLDLYKARRAQYDSLNIAHKQKVLDQTDVIGSTTILDNTFNNDGDIIATDSYETNIFKAHGDLMWTQFQVFIRELIYTILDLFYQAASLAIDTLRTFFLVVIVIVGPLSLGISVWDGFKDTFQFWVSRYIVIYMWLPVSNILGTVLTKIQVMMMAKALAEIETDTLAFTSSDFAYMIFMLIGITCFASVPTIAGFIVQSCGVGGAMRTMAGSATGATGAVAGAAGVAGAVGGRAMTGAGNILGASGNIKEGLSGQKTPSIASSAGQLTGYLSSKKPPQKDI